MTILVWRTIYSEYVLMLVKGDDKRIWAVLLTITLRNLHWLRLQNLLFVWTLEQLDLVMRKQEWLNGKERNDGQEDEEELLSTIALSERFTSCKTHTVRYLDGRTKRASFMVALALVCEWIWLGWFENDTGQTSDPTNRINNALYMYKKSKILKGHQSFLFFKH